MSVFIKFDREDVEAAMLQVKSIKNHLIEMNSLSSVKKNEIKQKEEMLKDASHSINKAHEQLQEIISLMPQIDSAPIKQHKTTVLKKEVSVAGEAPGNALAKLKDKISALK
jgi:hypothetical protein